MNSPISRDQGCGKTVVSWAMFMVAVWLATSSTWVPLVLAQPRAVETQAERALELENKKEPLGIERAYFRQRAFPGQSIPPRAKLRALQQRAAMQEVAKSQIRLGATASLTAALAGASWTLIGPAPLGSSAGRAAAVAVDPRNAQVAYLGTAGGGVWKTTDGGVNWSPLTDSQSTLTTGALAIDPSAPDTIYVGTGEGTNYPYTTEAGAGLLKSVDGGLTWTNVLLPFVPSNAPAENFSGIAVSPRDGRMLLAATSKGIYRSLDAGSTWTLALAAPSNSVGDDVLFNPGDPSIAYAAIGTAQVGSGTGTGVGIYRSSNAGQSWTPIAIDNLSPSSGFTLHSAVAVDPVNPTNVYCLIQEATTFTSHIFKSVDSGGNWTELSPVLVGSSKAWTRVLAVVPGNTNVIFAGGLSLYRSTDGGGTWAQVAPGHADQHALAFSADGTTAYIANDGGVYTSSAPLAATVSWTNRNSTLSTMTFFPGLSTDVNNTNHAFGGTQDNAGGRYSGLLQWSQSFTACSGDNGFSAIDFSNPNTIYTTPIEVSGCVPVKSVDNGTTFGAAGNGISGADFTYIFPPLVMDPSISSTLYYGTYRLYQTSNSAGSWTAISPDITRGPAPLQQNQSRLTGLAIAPSDGNVVYTTAENGAVYGTRNASAGAGATWTNLTRSPLPVRFASSVAVDPQNAAKAYVVFSGYGTKATSAGGPVFAGGHVFGTNDYGATWADLSGDLPDIPVNAIAVDPDTHNTLYVGTDIGVFATDNNGVSWSVMGQGLPNAIVTSLWMHQPTRLLRAGTHGRSVWDVIVPSSPFSISPESISFGGQPVQSTSAARPIAVTNNRRSGGSLSVDSVSVSGDFSQTNNCGTALAPGASCTINVTFSPTATDTRAGSVTIVVAGVTQTVALDGTGTVSVSLVASPTAAMTGQSISLTWSSQSIATCSASGGGSGDGWAGAKPASGIATVTESTAANYTFTIVCTAGSQSAQAQATVTVSPAWTLAPSSLSFASQVVQTTSAAQTVTVTNSAQSGAALTVSSVTPAGDFSQTNNCGTALPTGASCTINVTFLPKAAGPRTGTVTIVAAGTARSVTLSGTGTISVSLSVSPTTVNAGASATLTWLSQSIASCVASGGSAGDGWSGSKASSGSLSVTVSTAGMYTYTMTCSVGSTSISSNATLTVSTPPAQSSGGGGAMNPLYLLCLFGIRLLMMRRRHCH